MESTYSRTRFKRVYAWTLADRQGADTTSTAGAHYRGGVATDLRQAIEGWAGFYGAVANASAALLGLVFVGVSIHLSRRPANGETGL